MSAANPFSGVELPIGWQVSTVDGIKAQEPDACVSGPFGSSIKSKFFRAEGVPVIRGSNLSLGVKRFVDDEFVFVDEELAQKFWKQNVVANDLVFTCWGSVGQVGLIPKDGPFDRYIISNKQLKLRVDTDRMDPVYAYWFFASPTVSAYIQSQAKGAAVPGISLGILKSVPVIVPPLPTQRRIAAILSAYDDLIEVNTRRIAILEEMARRVYEEWFVTGEPRAHSRLVEVVDITMGQSPKSEFYNEAAEGLPFHQGVADFGVFYPSNRLFCSVAGREARAGDILMSVRAPVGRINVAPERMIIGRGLAAIRSRTGMQSFLLSAIKTVFKAEDSMGSGTIFNSVSKRDVEGIEIPTATEDETRRYEDACKPQWDLLGILVKQNANLRAQRDLLLPRLVSGKLSVDEAERQVEETAA